MSVDVIRSVLRIVFENEYRGVGPVFFAVADCFDKAAQCEVIVGDVGARSRRTRSRPFSMVASDAHDPKLRQTAIRLVGVELFQPCIDAFVVRDRQVP